VVSGTVGCFVISVGLPVFVAEVGWLVLSTVGDLVSPQFTFLGQSQNH